MQETEGLQLVEYEPVICKAGHFLDFRVSGYRIYRVLGFRQFRV